MNVKLGFTKSPAPAAKMEPQTGPNITLPASDLFLQLAADMKREESEFQITIPTITTWEAALDAAESALGEAASTTMVLVPHSDEQQDDIRRRALQTVDRQQVSPPGHWGARPLSGEYFHAYETYAQYLRDQANFEYQKAYLQYHLDHSYPNRAYDDKVASLVGFEIFVFIIVCGLAYIFGSKFRARV